MATIKDVARRAHVSVATVSRVLNNKKNVNPETKRLVEEAIEELNFKPNLLARSLFNKKSHLIGVIVPHMNCDYYAKLVQSLDDFLVEKGYKVLLCTCGDNASKTDEYVEFFSSYNVEGIIIVAPEDGINTDFEIPVVTIDGKIDNTIAVLSDYKQAGNHVADYIISNKLSPALILTSVNDRLVYHEKNEAIKTKLNAAGIEYHIEPLNTLEPDGKRISALLKETPYKIVFTHSEIMCLLTYRILKKYSYKLPDDIQLISYYDPQVYNFVTPKISTVKVDIESVAHTAIDKLITLMENPESEQKDSIIDVEFIERDTTK